MVGLRQTEVLQLTLKDARSQAACRGQSCLSWLWVCCWRRCCKLDWTGNNLLAGCCRCCVCAMELDTFIAVRCTSGLQASPSCRRSRKSA